jgi:dCTP deaminase
LILSDIEIQIALKEKKILIIPAPTADQFTTSALDLILGEEIKEFTTAEDLQRTEPAGVNRALDIDLSTIDLLTFVDRYCRPARREADGSYLLQPEQFVLGITREFIELPKISKIAARVEGRSTLARLGLAIHLTAPTIHAGFRGHIALEMKNFGKYPLRLRPGQLAVCQLIFERLGRRPSGPIRTRYQDQKTLGRRKA